MTSLFTLVQHLLSSIINSVLYIIMPNRRERRRRESARANAEANATAAHNTNMETTNSSSSSAVSASAATSHMHEGDEKKDNEGSGSHHHPQGTAKKVTVPVGASLITRKRSMELLSLLPENIAINIGRFLYSVEIVISQIVTTYQ